MYLSLGTRTYNLTDFSRELKKCPSCEKNGVMIGSYVNYLQFNSMPIYARNKFATAHCRKCEAKFQSGNNPQIDVYLSEAVQSIEVPKSLYIGSILIPLAAISAVAFFNSFK